MRTLSIDRQEIYTAGIGQFNYIGLHEKAGFRVDPEYSDTAWPFICRYDKIAWWIYVDGLRNVEMSGNASCKSQFSGGWVNGEACNAVVSAIWDVKEFAVGGDTNSRVCVHTDITIR